jgi:hypothetical protein
MPIQYLRRLTSPERSEDANRRLGQSLAFVAGAANAGGFLAVKQYTSHMSGIVSAIADAGGLLMRPWPRSRVEASFEGRIDGTLVWPPRGTRGFGYDPMFVPEGHSLTFGEMEPGAKHAMSHRARAFRQFVEACLG